MTASPVSSVNQSWCYTHLQMSQSCYDETLTTLLDKKNYRNYLRSYRKVSAKRAVVGVVLCDPVALYVLQ